MGKAFTFELKGADKVLANLNALPKKMKERIAGKIEETMNAINREQVTLAPVDNSFLRQSITAVKKIAEIGFSIEANASYAPYVEFGTRKLAVIPTELESYASLFNKKTGGTFEELLEEIKEWCRRKGIDAKFAYPIALKIVRVGTAPQPFFFAPYLTRKQKLINDIEKIVNTP